MASCPTSLGGSECFLTNKNKRRGRRAVTYYWRSRDCQTAERTETLGRPALGTGGLHAGWLAAALLALGLGGCGTAAPIDRPPLEFSDAALPERTESYPNWPYPPEPLEALLGETLVSGDFKLTERKQTEYGGSGPSRVTYYFPKIERSIRFKWKAVPSDELETVNNSPRKEIAAYEIQKLFLDSEDYVVPTTLLHCEPMGRYAEMQGALRPSMKGTDCVLGVLSVWLEDVTVAKTLYEAARFTKEPGYAHYMANFNLLTYLIDHKDARESNFLVAKDKTRRQVFSIDNGIAFQPFLYKFFADNWNVIRVAGLREKHVERLREIEREDLDVLGIVAQFEKDEDGVMVPVAFGENISANTGVRRRNGVLQIGLARFEIDGIWARIQRLLEEVERGEIPLF